MNHGDAELFADPVELRAQALVLEHSHDALRDLANSLVAPEHDTHGSDALEASLARSAAVFAGVADGIADGLIQLSEMVRTEADRAGRDIA